jgi:transposase
MANGKGYHHPQEFKEHIYELHKAGQSVPKLSSEYGVPTGTIYKWMYLPSM